MQKEKEIKEERLHFKQERDRERQRMKEDIKARMRANKNCSNEIKVELVGVPSFMQVKQEDNEGVNEEKE